MPYGRSTDILEECGRFLPSLALTSVGPAGGMASDSASLALVAGVLRWRDRFPSLADRDDDVPRRLRTRAVQPGGPARTGGGAYLRARRVRSWAACLPEDGSVVVVLSNNMVDDGWADRWSMPCVQVDAAGLILDSFQDPHPLTASGTRSDRSEPDAAFGGHLRVSTT